MSKKYGRKCNRKLGLLVYDRQVSKIAYLQYKKCPVQTLLMGKVFKSPPSYIYIYITQWSMLDFNWSKVHLGQVPDIVGQAQHESRLDQILNLAWKFLGSGYGNPTWPDSEIQIWSGLIVILIGFQLSKNDFRRSDLGLDWAWSALAEQPEMGPNWTHTTYLSHGELWVGLVQVWVVKLGPRI